MRIGSIALCLGFVSLIGCGDDNGGNNGPGDAAGVFPAAGFAGRTIRVEIINPELVARSKPGYFAR